VARIGDRNFANLRAFAADQVLIAPEDRICGFMLEMLDVEGIVPEPTGGRKKYYILRLPQRPGALRKFLGCLGPDDDISRFEYLKKSARNDGSVLLGVESRSRAEFKALAARMTVAGFGFQDITDDAVITSLII